MKTNNNQSAIEAMNIYQRAQAAGHQVKVSSSGNIREVKLYERIFEGLRSISSMSKPVDWETAAKDQISFSSFSSFRVRFQLQGQVLQSCSASALQGQVLQSCLTACQDNYA